MGDVRGLSQHDHRQPQRPVFLSDFLPRAIDWLFARGHAADLILLVMAIEAAWLVSRAHWPVAGSIYRLLPGALMIVALRLALTGAHWPWIALTLAASFPAHLADLAKGPAQR